MASIHCAGWEISGVGVACVPEEPCTGEIWVGDCIVGAGGGDGVVLASVRVGVMVEDEVW